MTYGQRLCGKIIQISYHIESNVCILLFSAFLSNFPEKKEEKKKKTEKCTDPESNRGPVLHFTTGLMNQVEESLTLTKQRVIRVFLNNGDYLCNGYKCKNCHKCEKQSPLNVIKFIHQM